MFPLPFHKIISNLENRVSKNSVFKCCQWGVNWTLQQVDLDIMDLNRCKESNGIIIFECTYSTQLIIQILLF